MNRFPFLLVALFVGSLCACRTDEAEPQLILSADHVLLQPNQTIQTADGLTVRADTVSVSICPKNANCFAPNNAFTRLTLSKNAQSNTVRLFAFIPNYERRIYPNMPVDSASIKFDGKPYKVILRDGRYAAGPENTVIQQVIIQVAPL